MLILCKVKQNSTPEAEVVVLNFTYLAGVRQNVWRVSWNITGTILASSGDDGCVRLWKANYLDNWKCFQVLKPDSNASEAERASMQAGASISTTPTSNAIRAAPPAGTMNIKRTSGWPFMNIKEDQGKMFY
ncbi:hypothetical protein RRG08_064747 [Elysia crispata]|uniref:Sec13-like protein n=1 Tax=Elysia crispata TaxID=231223 RepID=A0AAE0Z1F2_9GAST|nr:hypothetical protein RRG08_064747 [Elysia crispata]